MSKKKKEKEKEKPPKRGFISLSAVDFVQTPFSTSTRRPSKNTKCVSISFEGKHRSSRWRHKNPGLQSQHMAWSEWIRITGIARGGSK